MTFRNLPFNRSFLFVSVLAVATAAAACGRQDGGSDDPDLASAEAASTTVESSGDVAAMNGYFVSTSEPSTMASGDASAQVSAEIAASITADVAVPECVVIDTDNATYVQVTFNDCTGQGGRLHLDGTVRAELGFETSPCGAFDCPTALLCDLTTSDLILNGREISGAWQIRQPFDAGATFTWEGGMTIVGPRGQVETSSSASWSFDGSCVDLHALDAEVTGPRGSYTIHAANIHKCPGECPSSGSVSIQGAAGASLTFDYDGNPLATLTGRAGGSIEIELACGE